MLADLFRSSLLSHLLFQTKAGAGEGLWQHVLPLNLRLVADLRLLGWIVVLWLLSNLVGSPAPLFLVGVLLGMTLVVQQYLLPALESGNPSL